MGHADSTVWFRYIGAHQLADPAAPTEGRVIVDACCSFLKQLTDPCEIDVTAWAGPPGCSSIEVTREAPACPSH